MGLIWFPAYADGVAQGFGLCATVEKSVVQFEVVLND
jgi:hypothetical protein